MTLTEFLLARIADDERWCHVMTEAAQQMKGDPRAQGLVDDLMPTLLAMLGDPSVARLMADRTDSGVKAPNDLAQLLAECEAKRRIVEIACGPWTAEQIEALLPDNHGSSELVDEETGEVDVVPEWTTARLLRALALPYADHPDFDPVWKLTDSLRG